MCTSPNISKKTSVSPTSFVELSIITENKTIYSCYKDLTTEDIDDEIEKGFNEVCRTINLL